MIQLLRSVFRSDRAQKVQAADGDIDLSQPLLYLSAQDPWTIKDSFSGCLVTGETGSGKTTASGAALARAFLGAGFGGLILTCKPGEAEIWKDYCAQTGRLDSLLVFGEQEKWRFNFLNYEGNRPDRGGRLTENIVELVTELVDLLERRESQGRSSDPYWDRALRQILRNSADLLLISRGELRLLEIYKVITSAPTDPEQLRSRSWQENSFCMRCVREGEARQKTDQQRHDFEITARFWLGEFACLSDRTRSIIVSCFTSLADVLLRGLAHELLCTRTNLVPEVTQAGAIILLDVPLKQFGVVGLMIQTIFKLLWQRSLERRSVAKHPIPNFLFIDEAQMFLCKSDPLFQTTARSARCASVLLTQNIGGLSAAIGKAATDTLTGNLTTKFMHCNTDVGTNEWCSNLFAKTYQHRLTSGTSTSEAESGRTATAHNTGGHEALQHQVLPIQFSTLRKGGPENDWCVDAFVFEGGRRWQASGKNHLRVTFKQR